jgi:hypothetical protein
LFGSWGSGKSTLIGLLQEEIRRQTEEEKAQRKARADAAGPTPSVPPDEEDDQTRRVANVVQIEFNAWSFIDSQNLWASLTSEIFDQLRAGGSEKWSQEAGPKLVKEVARKVAANELAASAAKTVVDEKEQRLAAAEADLQTTVDTRSGVATRQADAAFSQATESLPAGIRTALGSALRGDYPSQARGLLDRVRSVAAIWRRGQPVKFWPTAILTGAALLFPLLALALPPLSAWLQGFWPLPTGAGLLAAVAFAARPIGQIWRAINRYATALEDSDRQLAATEQQKTLAVESARAERDAAALQQSTAAGAVAAISGTAEDPARLLAYLLTESADIQAVRGHLGLLGSVRRCFQSLDDLIEKQRGAADTIDRIVLYIDDLDRCSAEQVGQILEAVHLLLAFKCFVVVVAIDARWLRRSLAISHPQFKPIGQSNDRTDVPERDDLPTPSDYLEKIFQIPFWMRGMDAASGPAEASSSYTRYVRHLLGPAPEDGSGGYEPRSPGDGAAGGAAPLAAMAPAAPEIDDDAAGYVTRVQLTQVERKLLDGLGPLAARSPRAVKRLINLYRLIRARVAQDQEPLFLTGGSSDVPSFASVQFTLALDAGLPAACVVALRSDIAAFSDAGWTVLADRPERLRDLTHNVFPAAVTLDPDADAFDRLKDRLVRAACLDGFVMGLEAAKAARGGRLDQADLDRAFEMTQRYSFRAI